MKIFKRLIVWILISLILQVPVLYYLNYLFKATGDVEIKQVDLSQKKVMRTMYKIPTGTENPTIKLSYDGAFMAYIQDKKLKVKDLESGAIKTVSASDMLVDKVDINGERKYQPVYEWVPDREMLMIGYLSTKDGVRSLKLMNYNPETGLKADAMEPITGVMEGRYISAIQTSPLNMLVFLKIDGKNRRTKLYRIDIMNHRRSIDTGVDFVGNMSLWQNTDEDSKDRLYFESLQQTANDNVQDQYVTEYGDYYYEPYQDVTYDTYGNKSYVTKYERKRHIITKLVKGTNSDSSGGAYLVKSIKDYSEVTRFSDLSENIVLLGIGKDDKVFLGKINKTTKEVEKVYMTSMDGDNRVDIELPYRSVARENIVIANDELYIDDIYGNQLIGLTNRKRVDYTGKLIQIVQGNKLVTVIGDKMYIKKVKSSDD